MKSIVNKIKLLSQKTPLGWFKYFSRKYQFSLPSKMGKKRVFLFLTPTHKNLGDQAITIAELFYLKQVLPAYQVIEIPDINYAKGIKLVSKVLTDQDIIMVHGGGNLGTLYPTAEKQRRLLMKNFSRNKIIIFPQSAFFGKDSEELSESKKIYSSNSNLTLMARESLTRDFLAKAFPKNKLLFTPDIVFFLNKKLKFKKTKRFGILIILRQDKEKSVPETYINSLLKQLKSEYQITISDTVINKDIVIDKQNREQYVKNKLNQFAAHQLVITDRLHGMLFSLLTKTPCIVFNNNNGKVKFTYLNWMSDLNYIKLMGTDNFDQVLQEIRKLLQVKPITKDFDQNFNELTDYLKSLEDS
ncbi:polysaccharide pyruvyl transferase family protein [Loigolactobacillus rennini]|uniref:Exopolysaccharide biosynthesis protein n=1 Tax=Loigolactobacillus rennini DSM 20253 TaxID=1423796 RepID=A0A0R2D8G6_9LACO|nr:polysaccharide pyruvyl transferase family protein [Loigolactobacillus rennini]KRN00185.1 exopolysaccharide biosynthesis protein [Loigolactobacillus rennini DSM 20253]